MKGIGNFILCVCVGGGVGAGACAAKHEGSECPNQGLNPCLLQWKHKVLTTVPSGNSRELVIFILSSYIITLNKAVLSGRHSFLYLQFS